MCDVIIYDGNCPFCREQVARLARWDGAGRLRFVSQHDPLVAREYGDLSAAQLQEQMYVVTRRGRRYGGAEAFRYLTRRLPWLWPLAPLLHVPFSLPLWQWAYRQVAKRRYGLKSPQDCGDSCRVPRN